MAKPASWSWVANQVVNDGHRALAQNLTALAPFWENTGTPGDLLTGQTASVATGVWATNTDAEINGPVYRTIDDQTVHFAANAAFQLDGDIAFSFWLTFKQAGKEANDCTILAAWTSLANGFWRIVGNGTNIWMQLQDATGLMTSANFGADISNALHTIAFSRTPDAGTGVYRVWVDKVLLGTYSAFARDPGSGNHKLVMGSNETPTVQNRWGDWALRAIWKGYALTQADVDLLHDGTAAGATHGFGLLEAGALSANERVSGGANLQDTSLNNPPTVLADIQDSVDSPDANWWEAVTVSAGIDVILGFPTPSSPPSGGQTFRLWLRKTAGAPNPTVTVYLYENGVQVGAALVSNVSITSTTGQLLDVPWSAGDLGTADGSLVQCRIVGTAAT